MDDRNDFDDAWDNSEEPAVHAERVADEIPDGEYEARITDFSCFQAKDGSFYTSFWLRVVGGLADGSQVQRFGKLTDRSAGYLKQDLKTITGRVPSRGEVYDKETGKTGTVRGEVVGRMVAIKQRSRSAQGTTYIDVYINAAMPLPTPPKQREPKPEPKPDPKPAPEGGWGDPHCPSCSGAGCDTCVSF